MGSEIIARYGAKHSYRARDRGTSSKYSWKYLNISVLLRWQNVAGGPTTRVQRPQDICWWDSACATEWYLRSFHSNHVHALEMGKKIIHQIRIKRWSDLIDNLSGAFFALIIVFVLYTLFELLLLRKMYNELKKGEFHPVSTQVRNYLNLRLRKLNTFRMLSRILSRVLFRNPPRLPPSTPNSARARLDLSFLASPFPYSFTPCAPCHFQSVSRDCIIDFDKLLNN